ncbi:hypothetical protein EJ07DRAFT_153281 [Lizonia empirigonia]|nr:hypothetical protein EJ07DRAFT_153281 [Lizonia empirigonia]
MRYRTYNPDGCTSSNFPVHSPRGNTDNSSMWSDYQSRTVSAVRFRRINSPEFTSQHMPEAARMEPPPRLRPRPLNPRFDLFSRNLHRDTVVRIDDGDCRTQPSAVSQRMDHRGRQYSPDNDMYLRSGRRPWRPPSPIWAPAKFPEWPQPQSSPSPPLASASPPEPLWRRLPKKAQSPTRLFGNIEIYSPPESPRSDYTRMAPFTSQSIRKRPDSDDLRYTAPISALTAEFTGIPIARNLAEADALRDLREARELRAKKGAQEKTHDFLRAAIGIVKGKERKAVFNEDFSFGPKTKQDEEDLIPPLSPRSSYSSLPDSASQVEHKPLKRQRHDSSSANGKEQSRCDGLDSSSPTPVQQPQAGSIAPDPLSKGFAASDVHPGQLVDFIASEVVGSADRSVEHMTSNYNLSDSVDKFKSSKQSHGQGCEEHHATISPKHGPVSRDTYLRRHLTAQFGCEGGPKDGPETAHRALNEQFRLQTCDLQRQPRTTRGHAPVCSEQMTETAIAEPTASTGTPPLSPVIKPTSTQTPVSPIPVGSTRVRRRSPLPRSRSTDTFLRNVRESLEAREEKALREEVRRLRETAKAQ